MLDSDEETAIGEIQVCGFMQAYYYYHKMRRKIEGAFAKADIPITASEYAIMSGLQFVSKTSRSFADDCATLGINVSTGRQALLNLDGKGLVRFRPSMSPPWTWRGDGREQLERANALAIEVVSGVLEYNQRPPSNDPPPDPLQDTMARFYSADDGARGRAE